jgi:hypothetical protein
MQLYENILQITLYLYTNLYISSLDLRYYPYMALYLNFGRLYINNNNANIIIFFFNIMICLNNFLHYLLYNFHFCGKPYNETSLTHRKQSEGYKIKILTHTLLYSGS